MRGFGQAPTNFAIETGMDLVARALKMDRIELRRRNFIRKDEFPYLIPSGSLYDSGDYHAVLEKALASASHQDLVAKRDAARAAGKLAGIGIACCLEPSGGNSAFEPLFNPKNETTTWMDSCAVKIDLSGAIVASMGTSSSGQGHETLVATVVGEILERDPDSIRVIHAVSYTHLDVYKRQFLEHHDQLFPAIDWGAMRGDDAETDMVHIRLAVDHLDDAAPPPVMDVADRRDIGARAGSQHEGGEKDGKTARTVHHREDSESTLRQGCRGARSIAARHCFCDPAARASICLLYTSRCV